MSNVTDMFVIIGDSDGPTGRITAEGIAPKVAEIIRGFIYQADPADADQTLGRVPVISCNRDDWSSLQGGPKVAGSAVIWFAWNYARPQELEERLKAEGFKHITVWSHHEFAGMDGIPPRVVSLGAPEPRTVYIPTSDGVADCEVRYAFTRYDDARAYCIDGEVIELELRDGPVKTRTWHKIFWLPPLGPHESSTEKDFDGYPDRVEYAWVHGNAGTPRRSALTVEGWDLNRVREAYGEQRARHEGVAPPDAEEQT